MPPAFELRKLVAGFGHCLRVVVLRRGSERYHWIKDGLVRPLLLRGQPQVFDLLLQLLLDRFHLLRQIELLKQFGEIVDIVFVVHLRKFLEDDKLIDRAVDLLAPCLFEG